MVLFCLMCLFDGGALNAQTDESLRGMVFGYAVPWVPLNETIGALPYIDRLKIMEMPIGPDGVVANPHGWPTKWEALRGAAAARGIPVDVVLTQFESSGFNALFGSTRHVKELEKAVLRLISDDKVAGVHLDIEIFQPVDKQAALRYRQFIASMGRQFKSMQPQRLLSVFFFHGADVHLYDAQTMAHFDHVVLQGYDAHWRDAEFAGPVSPLKGDDAVTWARLLSTVQALGVPPQRVLMGFPTFGYEWDVEPCLPRGKRVGPGRTTPFGRVVLPLVPSIQASVLNRVLAHGAHYDEESGSAFYRFNRSNGVCVVGWFEDWWTLQRKVDWVTRQGAAGMTAFPLGYDNNELVGFAARRLRARPLPESIKFDAH